MPFFNIVVLLQSLIIKKIRICLLILLRIAIFSSKSSIVSLLSRSLMCIFIKTKFERMETLSITLFDIAP